MTVKSFDLLEFRKLYPIRPYQDVVYRGEEWEAISYPWPNSSSPRATWEPSDGASINIRKKDDPTSMVEVDAAEVAAK